MLNKRLCFLAIFFAKNLVVGPSAFLSKPLDEHPAKKMLSKYTTILDCKVFFALEWQLHETIGQMIQYQADSGQETESTAFKLTIADLFRAVNSIVVTQLEQLSITISKTDKSWLAKDGRSLSPIDNCCAMIAFEFLRIQSALNDKLVTCDKSLLSIADLQKWLKFFKGLFARFWRAMEVRSNYPNQKPPEFVVSNSVVRFDYNHNNILGLGAISPSNMRTSNIAFERFATQEFTFLSKELDDALRDDFVDIRKNISAKSATAFFGVVIKLFGVLVKLQTEVLLELSPEVYDKFYQCVFKLLTEFDRRHARISRFPSCDDFAKEVLWKLGYWLYNIFPYRDCSVESSCNDWKITEAFWAICNKLNRRFCVNTKRIAMPFAQ